MNMGKLRLRVLIAGLVLFAAALATPAIVFKPDTRSNPKRDECAVAVADNMVCESFAFGGSGMSSCGRADAFKAGATFVDKRKILDYCQGWDAPVAASSYGYAILLTGFLGVLLGVFAWFANPLMLVAVLLALSGRRRVAGVLAVASVALALQSWSLEFVPFNESSMNPSNLNYVDHLGVGFYLWLASLLTLTVVCLLKTERG